MAFGLLNLLDADLNYPVFNTMCSCLDILSIVRLSRTCKSLSTLQARIWDSSRLNRLIGRFMVDPERFREELRKSNTVISGSLAVQFFDRVVWTESDMDLFVAEGKNAKMLRRYLREEEGYSQDRSNGASDRTYVRFFGKVSEIELNGVDCVMDC